MKDIYGSDWVFYDIVEKNLKNLLQTCDLKERKLVLFGITEATSVAIDFLKKQGLKIYAVIDNNTTRRNFIDSNISVCAPEELLSVYDDEVLVLIGTPYFDEMSNQLIKLGYDKEKHIYQFFDPRVELKKYEISGLKEVSEDESKKIQFEILKYIHDICEENNLQYFLAYGSLLGAVRHSGFIPWDDDIDIYMPISSINELYRLLEKDVRYKMCMPACTDGYFYMYARVIDTRTILNIIDFPLLIKSGISIDIFPLVYLGNTVDEAQKIMNESYYEQKRIKNMISEKKTSNEIFRNIRILWDKLEKRNYQDCKYCGNVFGPYGYKEILQSEIFSEKDNYNFENTKFWGPVDSKFYLTHMYGNYLEYPPLDKRKSPHIWKGYWRNTI